MGPESILRMPAGDAQILGGNLSSDVVDCAELLLQQRFVKSPAEIEKIRHVCQITSGAFETLPSFAKIGHSELDITKRMRIDLLERGADNTPFMVAGSGPGGFSSGLALCRIVPPSNREGVCSDESLVARAIFRFGGEAVATRPAH